MDVGLFCDTYPLELDGVGMVVKNYARELTSRGERCCMVVPKADSQNDQGKLNYRLLQYRGITVPKAKQYRAGVPSFDFNYLKGQRGLSFDILHAHSPFGAGFEALRLSRLYDVPLVGTFHSKYYDDFYLATKSELLANMGVKLVLSFLNSCDEVWTVTQASKKVLRDYGYEHDIIVMPNGTEAREPSLAQKHRAQLSFAINPKGPVLLYVGQQHWKKNIRAMIEAVKLLRRERDDFTMVMAGQGENEAQIKALVRESGLDKCFRFTGQITDRSLLMGLYACADLLMFPSLYDTAGLVVQEAAAAKTPSLVVRGSCAAECVIDKHNGYMCQDSPQSIYEALSDILKDPLLLCAVGENASRTIPVPWPNIISSAVERYETLIQSHNDTEKNKKRSARAFEDKLGDIINGIALGRYDERPGEGLEEAIQRLEKKLEERLGGMLDGILDKRLDERLDSILESLIERKKE